jgi:hypothetical protein
MRASWAGLLACALMAACSPTAQNARPDGTLEPTLTESSAMPTSRPKPSRACKLLTSEERSDLVRMSMDALVPVRPVSGTEECIWTHSLSEPARSAIRVIAVDGRAWAQVARPQLIKAINHPSTDSAQDRKLRKALVELSTEGEDVTDERICEIYLLFTESRGMQRTDDLLLTGTIGSMPAVYAASCDQGTVVLAGFGEYGIRGSIAINHAVFRLVDAASGRVGEVLNDAATDEDGTDPTDEDGTDTADGQGADPAEGDGAEADETDSEADNE